MLLRAEYPAMDGFGRDDLLRLMLTDVASGDPVATANAKAVSKKITLEHEGVTIDCRLTDQFEPLHR